jgi:hypothetical protein
LLTQLRSLANHNLRGFRQQHPDRNLQSLPPWVYYADRPISSLRPAKDLKSSALERVERIKNLDVRALRTQGIVGVGSIIRISTA